MSSGESNSPTGQALVFVLGCLLVVGDLRGQSNPPPAFAPVPVSDAPTKALQVVGNNLFVAAWGNGVQILDISDPTHLRWKGGWNPRQCPMGIHVVGNYAYVANRTAGLSVLDIRNPANPVLVGSLRIPGVDAMSINVSGNFAYVADYPTGFRILDIKDPAHPVLIGTGAMPQAAKSIHAVDRYVFCTEPNGLQVFDVSNPREPVRIAERRIFGPAERVQIVEHQAFLATGQSGLLILDLTNPILPQAIDRLMMETNNLPIIIHRSAMSFSRFGYTWMLTNAAFRADLEKRCGTNLPDMNQIVAALRDSPHYHEYAHRNSGIPRALNGLHVTGRYALALYGGLQVIDVSDLTQPKRVGEYPLEGGGWDVRGAGHYAYVMNPGASIRVIDISNPMQPVEVSRFDSHKYASRILAVAEVEKPAAPVPVETYQNVPATTDAPELSDPERLPDGSFAFTLKGVADATYVIYATADFVAWTAITSNTLPAGGRARITDTDAAARSHYFYRAQMQ
jgi:hypothetical protein